MHAQAFDFLNAKMSYRHFDMRILSKTKLKCVKRFIYLIVHKLDGIQSSVVLRLELKHKIPSIKLAFEIPEISRKLKQFLKKILAISYLLIRWFHKFDQSIQLAIKTAAYPFDISYSKKKQANISLV